MRTLLLSLGCLAVLLASPGSASNYHRDVSGPVGLYSAHAWASGGAVYCDPTATVALASCGTGGVGGATIDITDQNGSGLTFLEGDCSVTIENPSNGGDVTFVCSTDRDNDGSYTNVDTSGSDDPDGFDDDFVVGTASAGDVPFCFAVDANGVFDDIRVFLEDTDSGSPAQGAGFFSVDLSNVHTVSSCGTSTGGVISAHTHGTYYGDPTPPPSPPPTGGGGWACAGT
jgi:hypothetical protein